MKQITWEDQWMGYDDVKTITMKKKWASGYCFGGSMVWSVDFDSGLGSDANDPNNDALVTTDGSCGPKNGRNICGDFLAGGVSALAGVLVLNWGLDEYMRKIY
ncbi:MAG: hypothetical protein ALECFALPRED_007221 [Alectoria fallacina]|uniref:GH18 domain-containing protein n=1 Tax=Alectoria fallacina TaxID=1903189 RepID=A0A8H3ERB6_9LECA|nr:MAG: hypothetical protein ALECFALPRED_007221 [Alectoria fallacina]